MTSSRTFHKTALAPLGITIRMGRGGAVGFGKDRKPDFWLNSGGLPSGPVHIAFTAASPALSSQLLRCLRHRS
jgi:hypothetical protein